MKNWEIGALAAGIFILVGGISYAVAEMIFRKRNGCVYGKDIY